MTNPLRAWLQRRYEAPYLFEGVDFPPGATCLEVGCRWGMGALLIWAVIYEQVRWVFYLQLLQGWLNVPKRRMRHEKANG